MRIEKKTYGYFSSHGFRQLLIKYITIVMIPLCILTPFVDMFLQDRFTASQCSKIRDVFNAAQSQVNYSLKMVDAICVSIDKSDNFVSSMLEINAYSRVNVCKLLNTYSILDSLYTSLCLYSTQTPNLIYSPIGTNLIDSLNEFNCFEPGTPPADQLRLLNERRLYSNLAATDDAPLTVDQLQHNHDWLYICPAALFSSSAVTVLLRMSTVNFFSAYSDVLNLFDSADCALVTTDSSGNLIGIAGSLYGKDELISPAWLDSQLDSADVAHFTVRHGNFVNHLLLRKSVLSAAIQPQMRIARIAFACALLLALTACLLIAKQAYRPIGMLRRSILAGVSGMPIDSSELQSIDHSIADIIHTYNRREEQSKHILGMMKQQLIYWALLNNLPRTESTDQLLNLTGLSQPNMLFCVLAIQLPSSTDAALVSNLCSDIQKPDWNHIGVTAVWISNHDTLAVVFHMFVELDTRGRQEYAANTLRMILEQYSITSGIGVGISQPTLYTLSRSYTTARRALSGPSVPYCLFEDILSNENDRFCGCLQDLTAQIN